MSRIEGLREPRGLLFIFIPEVPTNNLRDINKCFSSLVEHLQIKPNEICRPSMVFHDGEVILPGIILYNFNQYIVRARLQL